ncbi:Mpv17/PMP22 family protein [Candidatus Woesearchaeota archaeon]|jgi:hypothetical protein|nr:Mpv17/PMP22 family protein [Candidatus Woesearchaeota archaeon]MBT3537903.1 Mpv17/PMP22 family protein [Candidatus Woesearchaeota archaeon]MBT4698041.1 Mpv17/PMP22 family protein [Candidatus Woesearchaeota archaeon]MBT4716958.1 Mpv17/PMP22 family protein [Candidatus Woesearchaeota archaeon]MBT7105572.1 Mpv17/PMP22 family protein [Candidatus Woesearchaeota archaeon]
MDLGSILDAYVAFQAAHPVIGSMATAEVVYTASDAISQLVTDRKINPAKLGHTALSAPVYGIGLEALMQTGNAVGATISDNPIAMAALGPNLWGNLFNTVFFTNCTIAERVGYNIKEAFRSSVSDDAVELMNYERSERNGFLGFYDNVKSFCGNVRDKYFSNVPGREYMYATVATFTLWNGFQAANYAYIPDEMRTPVTLGAAFVWTIVMSLWSLKGGRKVVSEELQEIPELGKES